MRKALFLATSLFIILSFTNRLDVFDDISLAMKAGNARELSQYLSSRIELKIEDEEDSYSRSQAQQLINEFFTKNNPTNFSIIHKGESTNGSKYAIGNLQTKNGKFRTYFFLKKSGDDYFIQELRFERD